MPQNWGLNESVLIWCPSPRREYFREVIGFNNLERTLQLAIHLLISLPFKHQQAVYQASFGEKKVFQPSGSLGEENQQVYKNMFLPSFTQQVQVPARARAGHRITLPRWFPILHWRGPSLPELPRLLIKHIVAFLACLILIVKSDAPQPRSKKELRAIE